MLRPRPRRGRRPRARGEADEHDSTGKAHVAYDTPPTTRPGYDGVVLARGLKIAAAILAVVLILLGPHLAWRLKPARTLGVVLVDKTVPFKMYREHAAIPWILHALKLRQPNGKFLEASHDYVGFDPATRTGHDLTADDLAHADALVITDTYGVYVGDYEQPGDVAALERSPKIYGGLTKDETGAMESFAGRGGMILAEFNTFASPTDDPTRARLEKLFGARWTKWVGRYWPNLQDPNEVPKWVGRVYQRVTGAPFDMTGPGFVLVREDRDMVVLRPGDDLGADVVSQIRTNEGATYELPERGGFWFWMDILEATEGEVLYEHVLDVTPAGEKKLAAHGLKSRFPAVVKHRTTWYFAGDFVDNALDLGNPERGYVLPYKERTAGCGGGSTSEANEGGFFWGWYAPVMTRLFLSRAHGSTE